MLARFYALNLPARYATTPANAEQRCAPSNLLAVAQAHIMFPRSCALSSSARHAAALANTLNSAASDRTTVANAHAMLARFCALKSLTHCCCFAAYAHTINNNEPDCPTAVANAHAMLAKFYSSTSLTHRFAALASALNSGTSPLPSLAKAQATLARPWVLKSPMRCSAALAKALSSFDSRNLANAHAMLARC